jgi:glyoxylase I family protein
MYQQKFLCITRKKYSPTRTSKNMEDLLSTKVQNFNLGLWGARYQVKEVQRSIVFYTKMLGFNLDQQNLPAFGQVSIRNLKLILSGPGASGSRPMPDGRQQEPGGWNRIVLQVQDLPARIPNSGRRECISEMRSKSVPAADRSKWKTQMATRLSYLSLPNVENMYLAVV